MSKKSVEVQSKNFESDLENIKSTAQVHIKVLEHLLNSCRGLLKFNDITKLNAVNCTAKSSNM